MYSSGIGAAALLEDGGAVDELEEREHDPAHLARDRAADLVAVHHAGLHQRLAEAALRSLRIRARDAVEVLLGDAAHGDQRLAEPVRRRLLAANTSAPVVEEHDLDHASRRAPAGRRCGARPRAGGSSRRSGSARCR